MTKGTLTNETTISQKQMLLNHLQNIGPIDPMTALQEYGIYRLGARIGDLRAAGHHIETHTATAKDRRTGRIKQFALYELKDES